MTALQFRTAITKVGLSQVQAAHILGVTPRTARRWALGEAQVSPTAAKLINLMRQEILTKKQVKEA